MPANIGQAFFEHLRLKTQIRFCMLTLNLVEALPFQIKEIAPIFKMYRWGELKRIVRDSE
jgi:hypothetical protein